MHFSIPDTEYYKDSSGSYTAYNIHINGNFHCCLRYKQLHSLNEQLKRSYGATQVLPSFPPKKFLPLSANQTEERRTYLEQYVQLVGQDPVLSKSELLLTFLLNAQIESSSMEARDVNLDVFLMNEYSINLTCGTTERSSKVLEKACQSIDLPSDFTYYFALFISQKNDRDESVLVRKLMDFESPYISQRLIANSQIVIRKSFWELSHDLDLMKDKTALNLLYIQTISDVENDFIITPHEIREKLQSLQSRSSKIEYVELARQLPSYGCIQFANGIVDYPTPNTEATIVIGNNELSIRTNVGTKVQETKFKVTRMKCWRVTTMHHHHDDEDTASTDKPNLELSFEYLMSKNTLRWVTITSDNTMFLSVCLQGMVEELINEKDGSNFKAKSRDSIPITYIRRDGQKMPESSSVDTISSYNVSDAAVESISLQRKYRNNASTSVLFRSAKESVHNKAFDDGIGDEDL